MTRQPTDIELSTIVALATQIAPKYAFGCFVVDDVIQEAIIFGLDALGRWDGIRPLENFLSVHMSNRLKNLKRDRYYRFADANSIEAHRLAERKQRVLEPISLDVTSPEGEPRMAANGEAEDLAIAKEIISRINESLPRELRLAWKRMQDGAYVSPSKRSAILDVVKQFIED